MVIIVEAAVTVDLDHLQNLHIDQFRDPGLEHIPGLNQDRDPDLDTGQDPDLILDLDHENQIQDQDVDRKKDGIKRQREKRSVRGNITGAREVNQGPDHHLLDAVLIHLPIWIDDA